MGRFVVRVWLPDRPGALGAVASRIGSVRGDLVGIEILERGGGRAIDELVVELPDEDLVPLLVHEISEVDGVDVEDVRRSAGDADPRVDALETAASLVACASVPALLDLLARQAVAGFDADWAVVVDASVATPLVSAGQAPPAPWLRAFIAGSRASGRAWPPEVGPDDVAWAEMEVAELVLLLGRRDRPWRARERRQVAMLTRVVDHRWVELVDRSSCCLGDGAGEHGLRQAGA